MTIAELFELIKQFLHFLVEYFNDVADFINNLFPDGQFVPSDVAAGIFTHLTDTMINLLALWECFPFQHWYYCRSSPNHRKRLKLEQLERTDSYTWKTSKTTWHMRPQFTELSCTFLTQIPRRSIFAIFYLDSHQIVAFVVSEQQGNVVYIS